MAGKHKESAKRVVKLLAFLGDTQAQFARRLSITQPMVSAWVGASDAPSPAFCIRLGKLAPFPDNLWFWEQAGLSKQDIISAGQHILNERRALPSKDDIISIPRMRHTVAGFEQIDPAIPLLEEFVSDPISTIWIDVEEGLTGPFRMGDVIKVDRDGGTALDERFHNKLVLVEFPPKREGYRNFALSGRCIGTLVLHARSAYESILNFIPLRSVDEFGSTLLGYFYPPLKRADAEGVGLLKDMEREQVELRRIRVIGRVTGWLAVVKPSEK
jgi:transcriptional regulator with XRE-family HTH domain